MACERLGIDRPERDGVVLFLKSLGLAHLVHLVIFFTKYGIFPKAFL